MNVPSRSVRGFGRRNEHDDFARAVDAGPDSPYGPAAPDAPDALAGQGLDAELALVARLRRAGSDVAGPDRDTRGRIAAGIARGVRARPPGPSRKGRRRPTVAPVLAGAACLLIAFGGAVVLLAEDALPGSTLYDVKRARESASAELTFDQQGKAFKQLDHAALRVDELSELATGSGDASAFDIALTDFERDTREAVTGLTAVATATDGSQLTALLDWSGEQSSRLGEIGPALPTSAAGPHADTLRLLGRVADRAAALSDRMRCVQITSGARDDLGVLPSARQCAEHPGEVVSDFRDPTPGPDVPEASTPTGGAVPEPPVETPPYSGGQPPVDAAPTPDRPTMPQLSVLPIPVPDVLRPAPPTTAPGPSSTRPPLIEIPPLLPGLPGVPIG